MIIEYHVKNLIFAQLNLEMKLRDFQKKLFFVKVPPLNVALLTCATIPSYATATVYD